MSIPVATVTDLVERYRDIARERMRGLAIYNDRLEVEAIGFRDFKGHAMGALVTPWFMNLILLPQGDDWSDRPVGSVSEWSLPAGEHEFTTCRDESLGTYLSAVLFRTMTHFPDQQTAQAIAQEVLERLFAAPAAQQPQSGEETPSSTSPLSRRELFGGLGAR